MNRQQFIMCVSWDTLPELPETQNQSQISNWKLQPYFDHFQLGPYLVTQSNAAQKSIFLS